MPVDATATRDALIAAGERLFAERGIHGASIRDIVRAAGQANDSAVHYHFGSREGLILAICERHITTMEPARAALLAEHPRPDLGTAVADLVAPTAQLLRSADGRRFLQIMAQLQRHSGVRTGRLAPPLTGTALLTQLNTLERLAPVPQALARERVAFLVSSLTAALADRARTIDAGGRPALGHARFATNLAAMLAAALAAPNPGARSAAGR